MKKIFFIIILAVALVACNSTKKATSIPLTPINPMLSAVDSMSYALGINIGSRLANDLKSIPGDTVNKSLLIQAFSKSLNADSTILLDTETAQKYFENYIEVEQKKANEKMKAEGEKFLEENKQNDSIRVTASGLQYQVITEGNGKKPTATDHVKVHYIGKTLDGKVFDSSVERGTPAEFALNQVIKGWTEGVQLMNVGSKYKFFIPYNMAYGEHGVPQAGIPPYALLVFEVELLEILEY